MVIALSEEKKPQIDGYSIESLLGSGAMGAVYKALQESMGRHVALKVIHQRFAEDSEYVERFLREARSMGKLNHPNVVQGYDSGKSHGYYFLAMEFVEGESLNQILENDETLPEARARKVALDVTQALQHAHDRGLIHRDIKPSNIIGMRDGRNKVTDFGLARATEDPSLTMAGQTVGTPLYIAPELVDGSKPMTIKCDIYSLGATLYHLVAGEPPFVGKTATAVMAKHLRENPPPIEERCPTLTKGFCRVIARLMTKNFDLRPQTPADVLAMLNCLEPLGMAEEAVDLTATVVDNSRDLAFRETMDADAMEQHLANLPGEFAQEGPDTEPQTRPPVSADLAFRETMDSLPLDELPVATRAAGERVDATRAPRHQVAQTMAPSGAPVVMASDDESDDVELEVEAASDIHSQATEAAMPAVRLDAHSDTLPPTEETLPPQPAQPVEQPPQPAQPVAPAIVQQPAEVSPPAPAPPPAPVKQPAPTQPKGSGALEQMGSSPPPPSSTKTPPQTKPPRDSRPAFVAKPKAKAPLPPKRVLPQRKGQLTLAKTFGLVIPCLLVAFGGAQLVLLLIEQWPVAIKKEILHAIALGAGVLAPLAAVRLLEAPPLLAVVGLSGVAATSVFPAFGLFPMTREANLIVVALLSGWAALLASAIAEGARGREFPQASLGAFFLFAERLVVAVPLFAIFIGAGLEAMGAPLFIEAASQMALLQALALMGAIACLPAFEIAKTVAACAPLAEEDEPISAREGLKRPQLSKDERATTRQLIGLVFTIVCCVLLEVALAKTGVGKLRYVWAAAYLVPIILAAHFTNPLLTRPLATFFTALGPVLATVFLLRWHRLYKTFRLSQLQGQVILGLAMVCMAIMANALVEKVLRRKRGGSLGEMTYLLPRVFLHLFFAALLLAAYLYVTPFGRLLQAPVVFLLAMGSALTGGLSLEWTKWHLDRRQKSKPLIGLGGDWIVRPPA